MNLWLLIIGFLILAVIFAKLQPTCKDDEVLVRGVFKMVCVKGHQ